MTRRAALPTAEDIQLAIKEISETTGTPPTVLALARRVGLANTTFRRNFPDVATELLHRKTQPDHSGREPAADRFNQLKHDNERLRQDNRELVEHLDLAVASIQRLSLENLHLREQLEAAAKVTRLDRRNGPP